MTVASVFVGQCGIQIAEELWNLSESERRQKRPRSRILNKGNSGVRPHAGSSSGDEWMPLGPVLYVDTEPRVLKRPLIARGAQLASHTRAYGSGYTHRSIYQHSGCGNNWAVGYHKAVQRPAVPTSWTQADGWKCEDELSEKASLETIFENTFRLQVEGLDRFDGTNLFMSLAGGTGSGVGSALAELLRQEYPKAYLSTVVVAPFRNGDTPVQHYNFCLALSACQDVADCIIMKDNDHLLFRAQEVHGKQAKEPTTSENMAALNALIVRDLADFMLSDARRRLTGHSHPFNPMELVRRVCPLPSAKVIDITSISNAPTSANRTGGGSPEAVIEDLVRRYGYTYGYHERTKTTATARYAEHIDLLAVLHLKELTRQNMEVSSSPSYGSSASRASRSTGSSLKLQGYLKKFCRSVPWNPQALQSELRPSSASTDEPVITVASNGSGVLPVISHALERAETMLDHRAYLHWYERNGCAIEDIEEALEHCTSILRTYDDLLRP